MVFELSFLPPKIVAAIPEDLERMGPVRLAWVEDSQGEILATIPRFESR